MPFIVAWLKKKKKSECNSSTECNPSVYRETIEAEWWRQTHDEEVSVAPQTKEQLKENFQGIGGATDDLLN